MEHKIFKEKLLGQCREVVEKKIQILQTELSHLTQAKAEDTKSSAGDKYETGREMVNGEMNKLLGQMSGLKRSLATLNNLPQATSEHVSHGCLVKTQSDWIYIAISLGQMQVAKEKILVMSPAAPLAALLMGAKKGDSVNFRDNIYQIITIC